MAMHPTLRISATGDVLLHEPTLAAHRTRDGWDFTSLTGPLKVITGTCHLNVWQQESPLTRSASLAHGTRYPHGEECPPVYRAPAAIAEALVDAGFQACSTANNHAWDAGLDGVAETRAVLDALDVAVSGPNPASPDEHGTMFTIGPYQVAHFSYTHTLNNTHPTEGAPPGADWAGVNMWPLRGAAGVIADARHARQAGANVVLVSMHWGGAYDEASDQMRAFAREVLADGAVDWIIGNHPHVMQAVECINGRYVTYSHGNLITGRDPNLSPRRPDLSFVGRLHVTLGSDGNMVRSMDGFVTQIDAARGRFVEPADDVVDYAKSVLESHGTRVTLVPYWRY